VLGIYDGSPKWQELNITFDDNEEKIFQPDELDYFSRTFGVLTLSGKESLFAIDGQHRALAIRNAYEADEELFVDDEISIILVAHKSSLEGKERTRRLFSTLNRYAKPVKTNEIIALSEDDNAAIITRKLIDEYRLIENRIKISKQKTINDSDNRHFTTIIQLYEFIKSLLTQKKFSTYPKEKNTKREAQEYLHYRESEEVILKDYKYVKNILDKLIKNIIPLKEILIENKTLDRKLKSTSILFRPIGQNILFDLVCIALNEKKLSSVISFFNENTFILTHHVWQKVFINSETKSLNTDKYLQKYAKILIQEKLSIPVKKTKRDTEIYENFGFNKDDI